MRLIHKSTAGGLEIAGVPGIIEPGEPFEVPDEAAPGLLVQTDLFFEVDEEGKEIVAPDPEPEHKKARTTGGKK